MKLFTSVPIRVITGMKEEKDFVAEISRRLKITDSHLTKVIDDLEKGNFLIRHKKGRKTELELTKKGLEIRKHIEAIQRLI